jgi:hypothetical protein
MRIYQIMHRSVAYFIHKNFYIWHYEKNPVY